MNKIIVPVFTIAVLGLVYVWFVYLQSNNAPTSDIEAQVTDTKENSDQQAAHDVEAEVVLTAEQQQKIETLNLDLLASLGIEVDSEEMQQTKFHMQTYETEMAAAMTDYEREQVVAEFLQNTRSTFKPAFTPEQQKQADAYLAEYQAAIAVATTDEERHQAAENFQVQFDAIADSGLTAKQQEVLKEYEIAVEAVMQGE